MGLGNGEGRGIYNSECESHHDAIVHGGKDDFSDDAADGEFTEWLLVASTTCAFVGREASCLGS